MYRKESAHKSEGEDDNRAYFLLLQTSLLYGEELHVELEDIMEHFT